MEFTEILGLALIFYVHSMLQIMAKSDDFIQVITFPIITSCCYFVGFRCFWPFIERALG